MMKEWLKALSDELMTPEELVSATVKNKKSNTEFIEMYKLHCELIEDYENQFLEYLETISEDLVEIFNGLINGDEEDVSFEISTIKELGNDEYTVKIISSDRDILLTAFTDLCGKVIGKVDLTPGEFLELIETLTLEYIESEEK